MSAPICSIDPRPEMVEPKHDNLDHRGSRVEVEGTKLSQGWCDQP